MAASLELPAWKAQAEALIFASDQPIAPADLLQLLQQALKTDVNNLAFEAGMQQLMLYYQEPTFGFELLNIGGGYQFLTKQAQQATLTVLLQHQSKKRLSASSLETLAIIAYKQPITKPELEAMRGVNCDYVLQKLLEKELITIKGKSNLPGRPLLYATSQFFMDYFGINSLDELPKLDTFLEPKS